MRPDLESKALLTAAPDQLVLQRLRQLPDVSAVPYEFSEFTRRHSKRRLRETQRPLRLLAAALAVVVAGWVVRHGLSAVSGQESMLADVSDPQIMVPASDADAPSGEAGPRAVLLPTVSAETWLNEHPRQAIVRVPTQMAVSDLEDQIAALDDQLSAERLSQTPAQQMTVLQRDRAQLVESLAQVRYAQNLVAGLP